MVPPRSCEARRGTYVDFNACPRHLGRKRSARTADQRQPASAKASKITGDLSRRRPFRVGAAAGSQCDGRPGLGQRRIRRTLDRKATLGLQPEGQSDSLRKRICYFQKQIRPRLPVREKCTRRIEHTLGQRFQIAGVPKYLDRTSSIPRLGLKTRTSDRTTRDRSPSHRLPRLRKIVALNLVEDRTGRRLSTMHFFRKSASTLRQHGRVAEKSSRSDRAAASSAVRLASLTLSNTSPP